MALSLTNLKARIVRELGLLGLPDDNGQTDIICDALGRYVSIMDAPVIGASLSVLTTTDTYAVPATIKKLADVRDASGVSQPYVYDSTVNKVTFVTTPTVAATWTVYGTPAALRTNLSATIALVDENDEWVLWLFVRAFAHSRAGSNQFVDRLKEAMGAAYQARGDKNWSLDQNQTRVQHKDAQGRVIDDASPPEGHSVGISDEFANDL